MSQIDREIQAKRGSGAMLLDFASPLSGRLPQRHHDPLSVVGSRLAALLGRAVETVLTWRERVQMRRHLLALDDRMLKDIGISRFQAHGEAEKPFWRV
jgi:uncharacterized protein YjiS (DUF1127 family)